MFSIATNRDIIVTTSFFEWTEILLAQFYQFQVYWI